VSLISLSQFVLDIRQDVGDTGKSRETYSRDERLDGVDGTTKRFTLLYYPVMPGASPGSYDFQLRKTHLNVTTLLTIVTDYTLDAANGIVTTVNAPAGGPSVDPIDELKATYHFQWYDDDQYYDFVDDSCMIVGVTPDQTLAPPARAADSLVKLPDGLMDAVKKFCAHAFYKRRAAEYATRFNSSTSGQSVSVDVVTTNFRKLAEETFKEGMTLMYEFYKRRGAREAPAGVLGAARGLNVPYTPRR
jgi:hypothetical protein